MPKVVEPCNSSSSPLEWLSSILGRYTLGSLDKEGMEEVLGAETWEAEVGAGTWEEAETWTEAWEAEAGAGAGAEAWEVAAGAGAWEAEAGAGARALAEAADR